MLVDDFKPLDLAKRSIFCLQPFGDLLTRKGLFDTILMGCIPVTFSPLTASAMYTWFWPEELWKSIVIELPFHPTAFRYSDPIPILREMAQNVTFIAERQALLRKYVFSLHWSLEQMPSPNTKKSDTTWPLDPDSENGAYMHDAFETLLELTLGWHTGQLGRQWVGHIPPAISNGNPCWTGVLNSDSTMCISAPTAS